MTLTRCTCSKSSGETFSIGPRMLMPAELTRMSMLAIRSSRRRDGRVDLARIGHVARGRRRTVGRYSARSSSRACSLRAASRPAMGIAAPASASAFAISSPSPRLPPITSAVWPSSRNCQESSSSWESSAAQT